MIKTYKIKRELKRIARMPRDMLGDLVTYVFGTAYYDLFLAKQRVVIKGQKEESRKAAVYLIYPSFGLKPSHLRALGYLGSKGYATIVVSNLKLGASEKSQVLQHCESYIERPNFGYDFGGYRDGILELLSRDREFDNIVLLNDSVWFPISENADWLAEVEGLKVDFGAAASNFGVSRVDAEEFTDFHFNYSCAHRNFHYTSFALSFGKNLFVDPEFRKFWSGFPLTNKKRRTVKRGEIGLTRWVLKRGYSHGSTLPISDLAVELAKLDSERIKEIAQFVLIPEDTKMESVVLSVLDRIDEVDRDVLEKLILTSVARQGASYAIPFYNVLEQGFAFLKKSPVWLNARTSDLTLDLLEKIGSEAALEARTEALELRGKLRRG